MKQLGFDLIILGDSTAGKDTQAGILMKKYALTPVESGKFWRELGKKKKLSHLIKDRQRRSLPTPVKIIKKFLLESLNRAPKDKDLVFIGAGRLKPEAQYLVKQLRSKNRDFFALYIRLPKTQVIERSVRRGERPEDRDIARINNRIKYYKEQVSKTVKFYQKLKKLKFINGIQTIKQVSQDIEKAINDYQRRSALRPSPGLRPPSPEGRGKN